MLNLKELIKDLFYNKIKKNFQKLSILHKKIHLFIYKIKKDLIMTLYQKKRKKEFNQMLNNVTNIIIPVYNIQNQKKINGKK